MGRRDDNKRQKREALERGAIAQFRALGYDGASIEQIAVDAGVARGTFYLYFPDKLAIFDAVLDRVFEPVGTTFVAVAEQLRRAHTPDDVLAVYRGMAAGLALVVLAHPVEVEIAFRASRQTGEAGESLRRRELAMLDQVTAFTAEAAERGLIRVADPRLFSLMVIGAVERLFYEWMLGAPLGDPAVVADEVLGLFATALGLDRPR